MKRKITLETELKIINELIEHGVIKDYLDYFCGGYYEQYSC